jgi:hypothetical protein
LKAVIRLEAEDKKKALSLIRATLPDNLSTPRYLRMKSSVCGKLLTFDLETLRLDTLVATVDDLLSCIQAAEKSMVAIKKSESS